MSKIATVPPGRTTRAASASTASGAGTWLIRVWAITMSQAASTSSSARQSPIWKVIRSASPCS